MNQLDLDSVVTGIQTMRSSRKIGRITSLRQDVIHVAGLAGLARLGDQVLMQPSGREPVRGEVVAMAGESLTVLPSGAPNGLALGDRASLEAPVCLYPDDSWIGRVIDPFGQALDGMPLKHGDVPFSLYREAPSAVSRRPLGQRLDTGLVVFNTLLPIVQGQRIGLFAGSGVGKTTLLGQLAKNMKCDVVVLALVGERGREIRHFIDTVLGTEGMKRCVLVVATSDQSSVLRRQSAFTAMSIAEYFRDQGKSVLYFADSVTRLAEAHREVAVAAGEPPAMRGHPASMTSMITALCERAGPGTDRSGDITAIFSVLVAGSNMDEPVADTLRGVLDGHVILDREIAEAGRFPAVDVVKSVSRALPEAATDLENAMIFRTRKIMAAYETSKTMIKAGLYVEGSDHTLDQAIRIKDDLEAMLGRSEHAGIAESFASLGNVLRAAESYSKSARTNATARS